MTHLFFIFLITISSLALSSNIIRFAEAPAEVVGFWRLIIAFIILTLWQIRTDAQAYKKIRPHQWKLIILAAFFFFTHLWTYFIGIHSTSIANGMIIFSINPLFTALGAFFLFKESYTKRLLAAYLLAISGIFILVQKKYTGTSWGEGEIILLLSAVLISAYLLTSKKIRLELPNVLFSSLLFLFTALFFGVAGLIKGSHFTGYPVTTWGAIGLLVIFPTLMGHNLFIYLMEYLPANILSCGKLLEPVIASVSAYFLFNETITTKTLIAFALTASSVVVLFYKKKSPLIEEEF